MRIKLQVVDNTDNMYDDPPATEQLPGPVLHPAPVAQPTEQAGPSNGMPPAGTTAADAAGAAAEAEKRARIQANLQRVSAQVRTLVSLHVIVALSLSSREL